MKFSSPIVPRSRVAVYKTNLSEAFIYWNRQSGQTVGGDTSQTHTQHYVQLCAKLMPFAHLQFIRKEAR